MEKDRTGKDKMGNRVGQSSRGQNQLYIVWGPEGGGRTSHTVAYIILYCCRRRDVECFVSDIRFAWFLKYFKCSF